MKNLNEIARYLCATYPRPEDLSKTRLTKMVYLADWKFVLEYGKQLTNISWFYNHYGPYVDDVVESIKNEPDFFIKESPDGRIKEQACLCSQANTAIWSLTAEERNILDHVVKSTSGMNWQEFLHLIYSTFPILASEKFSTLDLIACAKRYRELLAR